jgi:hypothetical protein
MKAGLLITFLTTFLVAAAWPQTDQTMQPSSPTPWLATVNGDSGSLAFSSEAERVNLLRAGLALSSGYDDNAFSTATNHVGNVSFMVSPSISITEATTRAFWTFNYNPGFQWNQRLPQSHQASHDLDFNLQFRLTERFTARIHENYLDSSTSFRGISENPLLPGGSVLHQPNQSVITPLAKQVVNVTSLDLIDQIGEGTSIGASGSFNSLNYHETPDVAGAPLFNNQSWSADIFYNHSLSRRHSVGVTYSFQKIATFGPIREHVETQTIMMFYTVNPTPSMKLSFFVGPDRVVANDEFLLVLGPVLIPVSETNSKWLVDEGVTFGWQGQRTSAQFNFIHQVNDGGGLTGAVETHAVTAGFRRQLAAAWTAHVALDYGNNDPIGRAYGSAFSSVVGTIGADRQLGDHLSIGMRYSRGSQKHGAYGSGGSYGNSANHNWVWITVGYHFSRPLGR